MISFHNSEFHEKIMKKYGRKIRKSYFPNLFFKQDFRSAGQRKIHVSVHIKYAFHNYIFSKNFPLSYQKEKAHGISEFPLKFKVFGLNPLKPANEKNMFLNFISGKPEPQDLYRFTSLELSSPNLKYPGPITPEYISFNFVPIRFIDRKLTGCNLQLSNLRDLNPVSPEFGYLNYLSTDSTFPNFKILKLKIFENNSRVLMSKMRSGFQILQNCENSFLRGNSLFFTQSKLPMSREISFSKSGFFTGSAAYALFPLLTVSSLFWKIYNETLKRSEELKHSGRNISGRAVQKIRSSRRIKGSRYSEILLVPLIKPFIPEHLGQKLEAENKKVKTSWEKHDLIGRKAEQRHGELSAFRNIRNMSLPPSVQLLIQDFLEKTTFFLDYESLTGLKNPLIGQNLIYQQRKVVFPYSDKKINKILSACRRFSAKKTMTGKHIPRNFVKNLLISQSAFLKEDTPEFPILYIQQLTSKPTTLVRNRLFHLGFRSNSFPKDFRPSLFVKGLLIRNTLLTSNKEILGYGISINGAASTSGNHKSKRTMGHDSFERNFFEEFYNLFQQYPEIIYEAMTGTFTKIFAPSIVETNKNLQSVLKSSSYPEQKSNNISSLKSTFIHIFNCLTALTHNISTGFQQNEQRFQPDRLKITAVDRAAFPLGWQETPKPESSFFTQDFYFGAKPASSKLSYLFNVHRSLLARNELGHTTGTFGMYGIDMTGSPTNAIQEKRSHSRYTWVQKPFKLPEVLLPFRIITIKGENPAYPQKILLSREKENTTTYTPEKPLIQLFSLTRSRIFNNSDSAALKSSSIKKYIFNSSTVHTTGIKDIYSDLQHAFYALCYEGTFTFSEMNRNPEDRKVSSKGIYTANFPSTTNYLKTGYILSDSHRTARYSTNNQKMEHKREKKGEQQYSGSTTQIDKLQNKFIWPMFLKALNTIVYKFRKPEVLLSLSKQNTTSSGTKTPFFGSKEVDINSRQNYISRNTSIYTETYPIMWISNSLTTRKQSYPAFFPSFSVLPKKNILEYSRILDLTSGMNKSVTTEHLSILSNIPNPIPGGSLSSNIFLAGMPSTIASIPWLSRSFGITTGKNPIPAYNLLKYTSSLKYASSIISQYPLFAKIFKVPSNTEIERSSSENLRYKPASKHKPVSLLQLYKKQKPYRQEVSRWRTARMNLIPEDGKKVSANTENFLQRTSANSLKRENNNLQVNKKNIDTFTEAQMKQRFFSDFVLSSKYDFTKEMKWKKISSTTPKLEKTPKNMQDIFNRFLFRSKILKDSEKTAGFSSYPGAESTDFLFSRAGGAGKPSKVKAFGPSGRVKSELTYAGGDSNRKTERGDLVYGISEPLIDEVKKIKKIIFETREIVADHLGSHVSQVTGKPEQVMNIEDVSEKIMQVINRRLKIEAERRGIF